MNLETDVPKSLVLPSELRGPETILISESRVLLEGSLGPDEEFKSKCILEGASEKLFPLVQAAVDELNSEGASISEDNILQVIKDQNLELYESA